MTPKTIALAAAALLACPMPAGAQESTRDLLGLCDGTRLYENSADAAVGLCMTYIRGMVDMHAIAIEAAHAEPLFCLPEGGVSHSQIARAFMKWAARHPDSLDQTARVSVVIALHDTYPCG